MALLEQAVHDPFAPIKLDEAKAAMSTPGHVYKDDPALRLVLQDAVQAENFLQTKMYVLGIIYASSLYQSNYETRYWPGTQIPAASFPNFTLANAVNSLTPTIVNGLFFDNPPFMVQKRPGTKESTASAIGEVLSFQLEDIGFREEIRLGVMDALIFGTAVWKYGWETFTKTRKVYKRNSNALRMQRPLGGTVSITDDDDITEELVEEYVDRPFFKRITNLRHVFVDPALAVPDIRMAKYVIYRDYLTWEQLDELRERPGYEIPSREELVELFFPPKEENHAAMGEVDLKNPMWDARAEDRWKDTTADPLNQPLEILERWDGDKVIVVLNRKKVICNDQNDYGAVPFFSVGWWDIPESYLSMGLAKIIGSEQRLQQGITNLWIDNGTLNLNGVYVQVKGRNVPTQSIRIAPGKIINVDDKDAFKPLDRLPAVPEAAQFIAASQSRAEQMSGANDPTTQGLAGTSGHSNLARSAAGANILAAGANNKSADFVEKLANQVIIPFLYAAHELNRALLPAETLKDILNNELESAYLSEGGDVIELLNARVKFNILAGAKTQAKRAMAQALPIMIQILTSENTTQHLAIQGLKVDYSEVMKMMFEVSEWHNRNDVIVPMSPQDEQRWQSTTPAAAQQVKGQQEAAMNQQKFQQKAQLNDDQNIARAANQVLRQAYEKATEPFAVTGTPGETLGG